MIKRASYRYHTYRLGTPAYTPSGSTNAWPRRSSPTFGVKHLSNHLVCLIVCVCVSLYTHTAHWINFSICTFVHASTYTCTGLGTTACTPSGSTNAWPQRSSPAFGVKHLSNHLVCMLVCVCVLPHIQMCTMYMERIIWAPYVYTTYTFVHAHIHKHIHGYMPWTPAYTPSGSTNAWRQRSSPAFGVKHLSNRLVCTLVSVCVYPICTLTVHWNNYINDRNIYLFVYASTYTHSLGTTA